MIKSIAYHLDASRTRPYLLRRELHHGTTTPDVRQRHDILTVPISPCGPYSSSPPQALLRFFPLYSADIVSQSQPPASLAYRLVLDLAEALWGRALPVSCWTLPT